MEMKKSKGYREYWAVFWISAIPKICMALQAVPLKTLSDEVATVAAAAKLAGYDWSQVVARAGYYGAGFYWIFAPIFKLTDDPVIIYRFILVGCSLVQALIAPICYYLMLHYLGTKDKKYAFVTSVSCAYAVIVRATLMFNEHILVIVIWVTALLLAKLQEYQEIKGKKRLYTGLLMIVFGYSLTIHTRMLTLWIALGLLLVAYVIVYRCCFLSKSMVILWGIGAYAIAMKIVSKVQKVLWKTGNGSELRNGSVNIPFEVNWLSPRTWKAWGSIIAGQIQMINMVTGGLVVLFLFLFLFFFIKWIPEKKKKKPVEKRKDYYFIIIFFFLCCTAMTIGAQSISWLWGASEGISHGYKSQDYGIKAFTYLRYFGVYIGPLVMCGLSMLEHYKEDSDKAVTFAVPVSAVLIIIWLIVIQPFIYENIYTSEFFTGLSFFRVEERFELRHYLFGILWLIVIGGFLYSFVIKRELNKLVYLLAFYLIFQYCSNGLGYDISRQKNTFSWVDGAYKTVKNLEKTMNVPNEIYCYESREKADHYLFQLYQFYLNRYTVVPVAKEEVKSIPTGQMVFANIQDEETLLAKGYSCIAIDSNEYLYVDKKYKDVMKILDTME